MKQERKLSECQGSEACGICSEGEVCEARLRYERRLAMDAARRVLARKDTRTKVLGQMMRSAALRAGKA